jgi:SOS-response transcriptional repressor LexA
MIHVPHEARALRTKRPSTRPALTGPQRQVLLFVRAFITQHGMPPTVREIGGALGHKSPNSTRAHLDALVAKGVIEIVSLTARGIRLKGGRWRFEFTPDADGERLKAALQTEGP